MSVNPMNSTAEIENHPLVVKYIEDWKSKSTHKTNPNIGVFAKSCIAEQQRRELLATAIAQNYMYSHESVDEICKAIQEAL